MTPVQALAIDDTRNIAIADQEIPDRSITSAKATLEKKNSSTLNYWVTATCGSKADSMTATIVLQKSENGRWVNKETITRTMTNVTVFNVSGTISITSYGSGSYRIMVTISDVHGKITSTYGPFYSNTVVM